MVTLYFFSFTTTGALSSRPISQLSVRFPAFFTVEIADTAGVDAICPANTLTRNLIRCF